MCGLDISDSNMKHSPLRQQNCFLQKKFKTMTYSTVKANRMTIKLVFSYSWQGLNSTKCMEACRNRAVVYLSNESSHDLNCVATRIALNSVGTSAWNTDASAIYQRRVARAQKEERFSFGACVTSRSQLRPSYIVLSSLISRSSPTDFKAKEKLFAVYNKDVNTLAENFPRQLQYCSLCSMLFLFPFYLSISYEIQFVFSNVTQCIFDFPVTYLFAVISCGDPGTPLHGKQTNVKNGYNYGGSVEFICKDNYTLSGRSKIYCEETKDWSSPNPRCWGTLKVTLHYGIDHE